MLKFLPLLILFTGACKKPPPEPERICNDGADNDDDGLVDCKDPDCASYPDCRKPLAETVCDDGIDEDEDGTTDCADSDCKGNSACKEKQCDDGTDNDGDGATDCDDPDCAKMPACFVAPVQVVVKNFSRVQFQYDSTSMTGSSNSALSENAAILQANGGIRVEVQGHADNRGTTEYNLALGEKRAQAIKSKLTGMGVSPGQISIVSYGEERPIERGQGETAWSVNRRAEFRVTAGDPKAVKGTVQ